MKFSLAFIFLSSFLACAYASAWWQNAVFYQIYPRSFKDSDGDGIGDLQGITSKLDHLKDAGVTAAWLSPIFKSPQVDAGYDISDFRDIDEDFGTMKDFEELVARANELGIKIIMDLVPNHSSDQHVWFKLSENRTAGYEDYYLWRDGPNNDDITPPNNWLSNFKYSSWEYNNIRKQWYLHQFAKEQPDFDYRNPKILQEMKEIIYFWFDKGVYGFRVDAVNFISEDDRFLDEPVINPNVEEYNPDRLAHIYTMDQPGAYEAIYAFREFLEEYNAQRPDEDERILMTEAYANISNTMKWYGDGKRDGSHFPFNFELIPLTKEWTAHDIVGKVKFWLDNLPEGRTSNWVLGNHDKHRIASRANPKNADGLSMLVHLLPGVAVTYNGEEIAMENGEVTYEQGQDPSACIAPPADFGKYSRDFQRTPYQWDASKNAGFSDGDSTWLPVSQKYLKNNLEAQKKAEHSHFKVYQGLAKLRKEEDLLKNGELDIRSLNENLIVLRRFRNGREIVLLSNLGHKSEKVNLHNLIPSLSGELDVVLSSNKDTKGKVDPQAITLQGHEATILRN